MSVAPAAGRDLKEDRRTKYTKMVLSQSLLELMQEKEIAKITVTEICRKADINRNTFYKYYYGPEDLLSTLEDQLMEIITGSLSQSGDVTKMGRDLLSILLENKDLCRVILSDHGNQELLHRILKLTRHAFLEEWKLRVSPESAHHVENMYLYGEGGMIALIRHWVTSDFKDDIEDLVPYFPFTNAIIGKEIEKHAR